MKVGEVNLIDGGDGKTLPAYAAAYPATMAALLEQVHEDARHRHREGDHRQHRPDEREELAMQNIVAGRCESRSSARSS